MATREVYDTKGNLLRTETIPDFVPEAVTDLQARLALEEAGLLATVEVAVEAAGGATKLYWDRSLVIRRDSAFIASVGSAIGLSAAQIDALFVSAFHK